MTAAAQVTDLPAFRTNPAYQGQDYHALNAMLNLYDADGKIQFDADKAAVRGYFLDHVNQNTVYFHSLEEKINYLFDHEYYERATFDQYDWDFVKGLYKQVYAHQFRFPTFLGAFKAYTSYVLKTFDGKRYLERWEDRVTATALYLARGDEALASRLADEIILGRFQPATPTILNAAKAQRGELVSCFLLRVEDNMESIARGINSALQLSKRGGGVALNLTNLREQGAPIKQIENQSSGIIPVMKLLEDSFSYANQLGARQGAGAVYLSAHHPDIMRFLDTKRENADEKMRIKTLSLGIVVPDITFELAKAGEDMYLFSPYDVERVYGVPFSDIAISEKYREMVDDARIKKTKINAREFFQTVAELQFESGYPYIVFEDTVNRANPIAGRINMSNLCVTGDTQILTASGYRTVKDLYDTQEEFDVIVDERARTMDLNAMGVKRVSSTKMFKTAESADIYKVTTAEGFELRATEWHKMYVERDGDLVKIPLNEVEPGDKVLVQSAEGAFGREKDWNGEGSYDEYVNNLAYLAGGIAADGTFATPDENSSTGTSTSARLYLYGDKREFSVGFEHAARVAVAWSGAHVKEAAEPAFVDSPMYKRAALHSTAVARALAAEGFTEATKLRVPKFVLEGGNGRRGSRATQRAYLTGLFQLDGCVTSTSAGGASIELGSVSRELLVEVQRMLLNFGIYTRIYKSKKVGSLVSLPDGKGGYKDYYQSESWSLRATTQADFDGLADLITWGAKHQARIDEIRAARSGKKPYRTHRHMATVLSVEFDGVEDAYDVTVEDGNSVIFNGIATGNCSEILQVNTPSTFQENLNYDTVGKDISCNLGSLNITQAIAGGDFGGSVEAAIRALTAVSDLSDISAVPSIANGNAKSHAIGLGQMNLHGFLGAERIHYDSPEAVDFTSSYFATVAYHAIRASNLIAIERGETFDGFENSTYASGTFFDKYTSRSWKPQTEQVQAVFRKYKFRVPSKADWAQLRDSVKQHGLYNQNLQAIPPTGSISYINNATASIHPVAAPIEIRKEGKLGRVYFPAPGLDQDNLAYFKDAYEIGAEAIIDVYAAATEHVDQGLSLTLFFKDTATTRDVNRAQIYAWRKGIKSLYYIRIRQQALEGTEIDGCVSCAL